MTDVGRLILQAITIVFLVGLFLGCLIRVINKKGGWAEVFLAVMSVPSLLFAINV